MQKKKLALLSGFLLTACGQVGHKTGSFEPPAYKFAPEPASALGAHLVGCDGLDYYHALSQMALDDKKQELTALRASLQSQESSCEQLKLALLLSLPDSAIRNDIKAAKLLADFLENPVNDRQQDRALASLLRGVIQERLHSQRMQNTLKRKLKQKQSCLLYTSPSPRDQRGSRMPSSA